MTGVEKKKNESGDPGRRINWKTAWEVKTTWMWRMRRWKT